ncbi:MAG: glutamate--cysteine ligase [Alphaproteobacteria bacterium]|jgi:glutamate--cysteine ligase|nr:glutamate--cysteine ligase [Alphaproteobacteria bacterium]
MAAPTDSDGQPVASKAQLVEYLEAGCKPAADWRIGTEHEKFAYDIETLKRLPYEGTRGIGVLLDGLRRFGWEPVSEGGNVIALRKPDCCSVTLEPGGQLELSGAQLETVHETCAEVHEHLAEVKAVCEEIGAGVLGHGFDPKSKRDDISWMPKGRYKIMRAYMATKGELGHDMMLRTSTVQVNLDFSSEADMVRKMRVGVALQPVATALFANSPFTEGKPNGFLSCRSHVWTDTDPDRCGMLPFVFDDGFGFEAWTDYLLGVPMYFVYRGGQYLDVSGRSFRDFMAGELAGFEGETPSMGDWVDHMTTAFPEVRLKRFIEMRGADAGPWGSLCALPALWVGLLYDQTALDAAWDLAKDWSEEEREALRDEVPRLGLKTPFRQGTVQDLARDMLAIAEAGLKRRARLDNNGQDESIFIGELHEIAASGETPAERLLDAYENRWGGDIDRIYGEMSY